MSIGAEVRQPRGGVMPLRRKRRYAAGGFITLLVLAVVWPSPIVSANRLWLDAELAIDELSFLGREAHSWDVAFWFLAGLFVLMLARTADARASLSAPVEVLRAARRPGNFARRIAAGLAAGTVATAVTWLAVDDEILGAVEIARTPALEDVIRMVNRFGGGMNPAMIVLFFLVAGIAYVERRWVAYAVAMGASGLTAGIVAQVIKHLVGRARPELWLGPVHHAPGMSTSFPSGHTVGAFALAGVLVFGARSRLLRVTALLLATAVGLARIFAFRHWVSDVVASASIGLVTAWIFVALFRIGEAGEGPGGSHDEARPPGEPYESISPKFTDTSREQPASSIVTP